MIMAVEICENAPRFDVIKSALNELGEKIGVQIQIQLKSIFDSMHNVSLTKNN